MDTTENRRNGQELTGIEVAGFKSIVHKQSVEMRPLTLLAGANSSGKSSLMQSLLLLKQTLEVGYDPGALLLDGPIIRFAAAEQIFSHLAKGKSADTFDVVLHFGKGGLVSLAFGRHPSKAVEVRKAEYQLGPDKLVLTPEMKSEDILRQSPEGRGFSFFPESDKQPEMEYAVSTRRFFLSFSFKPKGEEGFFGPAPHAAAELAERFLRRLIHLPGLRGNPARTYPMTAVGKVFPGTFESYTAAVIANWQVEKAVGKLESLNGDLDALGLTWKATAKAVSDTQVALFVGRLPRPVRGGARDLVNIADVGFGVSQALPVVVALHAAESGQPVYLEQPEIHLHPKAQVALAKVLARAVKRGVQVIVETHSALLLLALQATIAEGAELSSRDVKLHWFKRDPKDGVTQIHSADLDQAGAYGDWPEDFGGVSLKLESRYLEAAQAQLPLQ